MNVLLLRGVRLAGQMLATLLACALAGTSGFGQAIGNSWEGLHAPTGSVPPDVHGAPGPQGIMATVNLEIAYFTKSGGTIWGPVNLQTFWSGVGNTGSGLSDPKVIFDPGSRRFFVLMQENTGSHFWFNLALSRSADPRGSTSADWIFYRFDATEFAGGNPAGGVNYGGDYPGFAVDGQALYATYRMYAFNPDGSLNGCGCTFTNAALLIMNKGALIAGSGTLSSLYLTGFNWQPVTPIGGSPGNVMYVVEIGGAADVWIASVTDPLGSRSVAYQNPAVTDFGGGTTSGAPQLGSVNTIDPINGRTLNNASLVGGDVWFCATRGQPSGPAVAAYYRLRLNGWPSSGSVSVVESSTVGDSSYWNFCPAIGANLAGQVAMTWTRSSSSTYPTMMYAYRNAGDSSFGAPHVVKASTAANNDGRWGDYATVWPDPDDGSLWMANEWTRSDTGTWSTWWAQVLTPATDFYVNWNAPFPFLQDGSLAFPYTTVGAAQANITHGTIHIYGGHNYNEQLTLYKSVVLQLYSGSPFAIGTP